MPEALHWRGLACVGSHIDTVFITMKYIAVSAYLERAGACFCHQVKAY